MKTHELANNNLSEIRKNAGVSQKKLASYLGISRSTLYCYEAGLTPIPSDIIIAICKKFSVSADYLLKIEP